RAVPWSPTRDCIAGRVARSNLSRDGTQRVDPEVGSSLDRLVPAWVALPGPDRDREHVLTRWDRAVVERREGAGRIVGAVEVERVAIAAQRFGVHVPAQGVALMAGRRVAEENRDRRFAGAGLQEPQSRQPQRTTLEG